jgi:hypothetical protein
MECIAREEAMQTNDEEREHVKRRAIEQMASAVLAMAEERHEAQKHYGTFHRCTDATCANAREAYLAL